MSRVANYKVLKQGGCELWQGSLDAVGRPLAFSHGKPFRLQRAIFQKVHGRPPGSKLHTTCGNAHCIAPAHLYDKETNTKISSLDQLNQLLANADPETAKVLEREIKKTQERLTR